jgi:predicted RecA/RadA family phage recombinase
MALNQVFAEGDKLNLPVPSGVLSGAPTVCGQIPVVAQTDRAADGTASCDLHGVYALSVKGVTNAAANIAVAAGDILYYTAGHTPVLDKDTTGIRYGYALQAVTSGATATINVKVGY